MPCLSRGLRRRESLEHVLLFCPEYAATRRSPEFATMCQSNAFANGICFYRDTWMWKSLHTLRKLIASLHSSQRQFHLSNMPRRSRLFNTEVSVLWEAST